MTYIKVIFSIIIILLLRYLYEEWKVIDRDNQNLTGYDLVNYYLLDEKNVILVLKI